MLIFSLCLLFCLVANKVKKEEEEEEEEEERKKERKDILGA